MPGLAHGYEGSGRPDRGTQGGGVGAGRGRPEQLADAALVEAVAALRPVVCQVQAAETRLVGAVHTRGAAALEGAVSTVAWLRNRLHDGAATTKVKSSVALARLPLVAAAFADGELTDGHVQIIAKVAADITDAAMAGGAEALLLDQARPRPPNGSIRSPPASATTSTPTRPTGAAARRLTDRWLHVDRTFDGAVALSRPARPRRRRTAHHRPGRADATPERRRRPHRLAAPRRRAAGPVPTRRQPQPGRRRRETPRHGHRRPGHPAPATQTPDQLNPDPAAALTSGATLGSGWSIGPQTARRLACDAKIIPLLLGGPSEPLDIGRLARSCPPALRRALVFRDGGCRYPGCDRPPEWTDAHHIMHWIDSGPTSLTNCVLLCRHHHVLVHEHGQTVTLDPATATVTVHDHHQRLVGTSQPRGRLPVRGQPPGTTHRKPTSADRLGQRGIGVLLDVAVSGRSSIRELSSSHSTARRRARTSRKTRQADCSCGSCRSSSLRKRRNAPRPSSARSRRRAACPSVMPSAKSTMSRYQT